MKKIKLFLIAALAIALTTLSLTGCENETSLEENGTSNKLTINNLPSSGTYAAYVFASGTDISTYQAITSAYTSGSYVAVGATASGNVFNLVGMNGTTPATTAWIGSGSFPVLLLKTGGSTTDATNAMYRWATVSFSSQTGGTVAFSNFTAVTDGGIINPGDGSKLTINDLPSGVTYAVYVFTSGTDISTFTAITSAYTSFSYQAVGATASGNVFNLVGMNGTTPATTAWTGSGDLPVLLLNASGSATDTANPMYSWATISFSEGTGTADFSGFTAVVSGGIINPGDGSKLTINDLPISVTYAVYVFTSGTDISTYQAITTAYTSFSYQAVGASASGNVFNLVGMNGITPSTTAWTGSGDLPVLLLNANGSATDTANPMYSWATVNFSEGTGTVDFSGFTAVVMGGGNQTPTADDYEFDNLTQFVGSVTDVIITPKQDKSAGSITIYYAGTDNTTYTKSPVVPTAAGTYAVTFDVAPATGWNAASGLSAGTLTITLSTPTFENVSDLASFLSGQEPNSKNDPYIVKLNISDLGSYPNSIKDMLQANPDKYVSLDFSGSTIITIPDNAFGDYNNIVCPSLTSIIIPDGVISIGKNAFANCSNLASVNIPNSVIRIWDSAFYLCTSLISVNIPDGVTNIEAGAFSNCWSLPNITIPDGVTKIDSYAFKDCTSLTSITIPNKVTSIGIWAFKDCSNLTSVKFEGTISSFTSDAFDGIGDLRTKYFAADGGPGTYTRPNGSNTWTRQAGENDCTVTFDSMGGSTVNSVIVESGSKITQPASPTKADHTFDGWYKESGIVNQWNFAVDTVTENITLYAKWNFVVAITSIEVTTLPTKTMYVIGDTLDLSGMIVTATYNNGTSNTVTGYTNSGFSSTTAGNKTITISYEGKTTTFNVTVNNIPVSFESVIADGVAGTETTTMLTLTFDKDIPGLDAAAISLTVGSTGAVKGALTSKGSGVYELAVSGIYNEGEVTVLVSKANYEFTPSSKAVTVNSTPPVQVAFLSLVSNGGPYVTTNKLTLTLDQDIPGLTAADISLWASNSNGSKGSLTSLGNGVYELAINGINYCTPTADNFIVSVNKPGYVISSSRSCSWYYARSVSFQSLSQNGSIYSTTTEIFIQLNYDMLGFSRTHITLDGGSTGATKGSYLQSVDGKGLFKLAVTDITQSGQVTVTIQQNIPNYTMSGYVVNPTSRTVNVFYVE